MLRLFVVIAAAAWAAAPLANAAPTAIGPCTSATDGAMTLSADGPQRCQGGQWQQVDQPAPASDTWASFDAMTLHGQGMQNPGVLAGQWTATPLSTPTRCRAEQRTVIAPGTLSTPMVDQGPPDAALTFRVLPTAFYVQFSGNCLWVRQT